MLMPQPPQGFGPEDFPGEGLKFVAAELGVEFAWQLWRACAGTKIHLPVRLSPRFIQMYLREHFDGSNTKAMARDLHISEQTVRQHLDERVEAAASAS